MELNPPQDDPAETPLSEYLRTDTFGEHLEAILPDHMGSERFVSVCLRQLGQVPELQNCSLRSVVGGMMEAATLGLEVGTQGECWLIPYNKVAQLQVGVWGHMALAWRSGLVADVQIDVVLKGDRFSFQKGTDGYLHHEPKIGRDLDNVAAIEWVYAVVRTLAGGRIFDAFDRNWIERIRRRSQAPNSPAWSDFYAEQAMAKALKKVLKVSPKSREMARAITLGDEADAGATQTWSVDTSFLLPAEVALDPKTQAAREAMRGMGAKPSRQPEPLSGESMSVDEAMAEMRSRPGRDPEPALVNDPERQHEGDMTAKRGPEEGPDPAPDDTPLGENLGW